MKSVKFGNKKALEIIDTDLKSQIKEFLWEKAKTRPMDKNYRILNKGSLQHLAKYPHLVTLSTYGKKFLLCLIKIEDKNHTIFVDRKREMMIYMPMGFDKNLYQGTIFDGELMKDNDGKWIYFVTDIPLYNGKSTYTKSLQERIEIVKDILGTQFIVNEMDFCAFEMKEYFPYKFLEDLSNGYRQRLNYKCSGLIFKNQVKSEKALLYIFIANRTNTVVPAGSIVPIKPKIKVIDDALLDDEEFIGENRVFLLKTTELPDVYELYALDKDQKKIKIGMAGITSLEVSQVVSNIIEDQEELNMECRFVPRFKKWEPVKVSKSDIYQINKNI